MIRDVITPDMLRCEWPALRAHIQHRVFASMGRSPGFPTTPEFHILSTRSLDSLTIREFRFEPLAGVSTYGSLVLPPAERATGRAVICMHGTDRVLAHRNVLSPDVKPNRQYAVELAKQGVTTLAVDQFAFGQGNGEQTQEEVIQGFYHAYPDWSLDGIRLWIHQRAIDLLPKMANVDGTQVGCIGHSLGGRTAVYLAAFDERIRACVASSGVSPNLTNVFRNRPGASSLSPILDAEIARTGVPLFEYQEVLAMVAPRALLLIEPWNDTCNPMIEPVLRCFEKARFVFQLCDAPENLQIVCHGNGHNTVPQVRHYAYAWLTERLTSLH
jgi:dienelactone hydrolase